MLRQSAPVIVQWTNQRARSAVSEKRGTGTRNKDPWASENRELATHKNAFLSVLYMNLSDEGLHYKRSFKLHSRRYQFYYSFNLLQTFRNIKMHFTHMLGSAIALLLLPSSLSMQINAAHGPHVSPRFLKHSDQQKLTEVST